MSADEQSDQGSRESPRDRIERLVAAGEIPREAVVAAEAIWRDRLQEGFAIADGEQVTMTLNDLYHCLVHGRTWRKPERIERILTGIFELRSADRGRRVALSRWEEDGRWLVGYAILEPNGRVWTMHVVDERRIRRFQRRGELLWRR